MKHLSQRILLTQCGMKQNIEH